MAQFVCYGEATTARIFGISINHIKFAVIKYRLSAIIVFENIYEKVDPNNPDTGDHSGIVVYAVILAASLLGMIVVLLAMNKPRRKAFRN